MKAKLQAYGARGLFVQGIAEHQRRTLEVALQRSPPPKMTEYVHGYENVLLVFESPPSLSDFNEWLESVPESKPASAPKGRPVKIPVIYDGKDLAYVARMTELTPAEVISLHAAPIYTVRMMGFSPGFPYLDGLDPRLHLERRASPRNHIAPGTVAIGGAHAGIYSVASPGGWHLLGRTDLSLFRPERASVARPQAKEIFALSPGDRIQFIPKD